MYSLPTDPLDIGRTLDQGIKFFLNTFKDIIGPALLASFCVFIPETILQFISFSDEPSSGLLLIVSVLYFVLAIVSFVIWISVGLKMWSIATQTQIDYRAILGKSFRLFPRTLLATFLYAFALIGGTLLLVIPGIYLSVALSLYYYLIIADDLTALESLKMSRNLVKGYWWRTLIVFTIPLVLIIAIFFVIGLFAGVGLGLSAPAGAEEGSVIFATVFSFATSCIQAVTTPIFFGIMFVLLNDLKIRKQGTDLGTRIDAMGSTT